MILPTIPPVIMETTKATALHTELKTDCPGHMRDIDDVSKGKKDEAMTSFGECDDAEEEEALSDDSLRLRLSDDEADAEDNAFPYAVAQHNMSLSKAKDVDSDAQIATASNEPSMLIQPSESLFDSTKSTSKSIKQEEQQSGNVSTDGKTMNNFYGINEEEMNMWHGGGGRGGRRGHPSNNYNSPPGWSQESFWRSSGGRSFHKTRPPFPRRGYRSDDNYNRPGGYYNSGESDSYNNRYYNNFSHYGRGRGGNGNGNYGQHFRDNYSRDGKPIANTNKNKYGSSTKVTGNATQVKQEIEDRDLHQMETTAKEAKQSPATKKDGNLGKKNDPESGPSREEQSKGAVGINARFNTNMMVKIENIASVGADEKMDVDDALGASNPEKNQKVGDDESGAKDDKSDSHGESNDSRVGMTVEGKDRNSGSEDASSSSTNEHSVNITNHDVDKTDSSSNVVEGNSALEVEFEPRSNIEDTAISLSGSVKQPAELEKKDDAFLDKSNNLDSFATAKQNEGEELEINETSESLADLKTVGAAEIQKESLGVGKQVGGISEEENIMDTIPESVDKAKDQSSSLSQVQLEHISEKPSVSNDSEPIDARSGKEQEERHQDVNKIDQNRKGAKESEHFNSSTEANVGNQETAGSQNNIEQGTNASSEQDKAEVGERNLSTKAQTEHSDVSIANSESVPKVQTLKSKDDEPKGSVQENEQSKESNEKLVEESDNIVPTKESSITDTKADTQTESAEATDLQTERLINKLGNMSEDSLGPVDSFSLPDESIASDSQAVKASQKQPDKPKTKMSKRRTRRTESDKSKSSDDSDRPSKLQKQEKVSSFEKTRASLTNSNDNLTNGTAAVQPGKRLSDLPLNEETKRTQQTVDDVTPKVANSGVNQTMVSADATASNVGDTTSKATTSTKNLDEESETENEPPVQLERRRKKVKRMPSSREIAQQEVAVKATEGRQKRRTAKNAEAIIRDKFLNNDSDFESSDSSGKFVALKSSYRSKTVRSLSPPALKRSCPDEGSVASGETKKVKIGPAPVEATLATQQPAAQGHQEGLKQLNYVRKFFRRDAKDRLAKLTQEDLEELLIQKLVETITMRGEIGKLREQARISERNQEACRIRCQQLAKQIKDFETVLNRNAVDRKANDNKPVPPIKINRSVGLQVNFLTEQGMQSLRQCQGFQTFKATIPGPTVVNGANVGFHESTDIPQRRGIKVRSPRRPEICAVSPASVQVQVQPPASPVTPAALVVTKAVELPNTSTLPIQSSNSVQQLLPKLSTIQTVAKPQAIVINRKNTSPSNRSTSIISVQKTKPNDLIDLTDEEDKTQKAAGSETITGATFSTIATTLAAPQKLHSRLPRVVQAIAGNLAITTPPADIRVVQPSSLPTPTALVNNMNAPRLAYVMHGTPGRQLLITNNQIRPVVSSTRTQFPVSFKAAGISTIANGTHRMLTTTASPSLQPISKHPAPLPESPHYPPHPTRKLPPPPPSLKISKVTHGIVLSWNMALTDKYAAIASYQLYAYQEIAGVSASTSLWKKVGDVESLALPMACTLTQFSEGNNYHFAVRAVDVFARLGPYSAPGHISL